MTLDPETERQIAELSHDPRPLLVLDVDDVVLEFVRPFPRFLEMQGYSLSFNDFRLTGNITEIATGRVLERETVQGLLYAFFETQSDWQTVTDGASEVLETLSPHAEIVLLTAMPHRFRDTRRSHLQSLGLTYPLLTVELAKGPAIERLRGTGRRPVAFVDDQPKNLASARQSVPDIHLFHLMADNSLRAFLPAPEPDVIVVRDWPDARPRIAQALDI